ncbi:riboflavin synthase [bacterium]|nr:riboflavin synthase [bacterium]
MFTGLIEEIGKIKKIQPFGSALRLTVSAKKILSDLKIDDSVSINGACQTVVSLTNDSFTAEAVEETLKKTTLGKLAILQNVNLERAMLATSRFGGHFVNGHVDCVGTVKKITVNQSSYLLEVAFPPKISGYVVEQGSVCLNGVSLTIARLSEQTFTVSVIPHTWKNTNLAELRTGLEVNIETDVLGKYVERLLVSGKQKLTEVKLLELGF